MQAGISHLIAQKLPLEEFFKQVSAAGYDGPLISEVPASLAPFAETAQAIRAIMAL